MTTNLKIHQDIHKLNVGSPIVSLFKLDLTPIAPAEDPIYFSIGPVDGAIITFNGVDYPPIPVEVEGFEYPGDGKMPRPKIKISNITLALIAYVNAYKDLCGCIITRRRTFKKYLDSQSGADPNAQFPSDVYYIEKKTRQNPLFIEWELAAIMDNENLITPKRQVLTICTHRYGIGGSTTTCPYDGGEGYYDEAGNVEILANDMCGKKLFDCKLRYPNSDDELPFYGFPGIGKVGTPYRR